MRLWHEDLIPLLPRQQLLGQHRECCALRGNGWGKKHATVDYVFQHPRSWLWAYHRKVMREMIYRGYHVDLQWGSMFYRGKSCLPDMSISQQDYDEAISRMSGYSLVYPEHNDDYLQECLDNLANKGIYLQNSKN